MLHFGQINMAYAMKSHEPEVPNRNKLHPLRNRGTVDIQWLLVTSVDD